LGGRRSGVPRYLIPSYLGIHLAVSYLLASKLVYVQSVRWQKIWAWITALVLSISISSGIIISSAGTWWNKGTADYVRLHQIANILNQTQNPLVVSDTDFIEIFTTSHVLNSNVDFQLITQPKELVIRDNRENIFVLTPSPSLQKHLETSYTLEPVYVGKNPIPNFAKLQVVS
jgi:hypothetical protein